MVAWEYQVIRLNIEPPVAAAPGQDGAPAEPPAAQPGASTQPAAGSKPSERVFSEAYLKEEFPRFYDSGDQAAQAQLQAQAQQADPAFQLQDFLNSQGQQGWELVGFQHAMPHVFIVFKRPKDGQDGAASASAQAAEQLKLSLDLASRALAIIEKQAG
jgi:hypothetical protein